MRFQVRNVGLRFGESTIGARSLTSRAPISLLRLV